MASPRARFAALCGQMEAGALVPLALVAFALMNPLGGALSNALVPKYRDLPRKDKAGWATRVPAFVHAVLVAYLSYASFVEEKLYADPWDAESDSMRATILVSLGYMLYDTANEARCALTCPGYKATLDMITHHVVTSACMGAFLNQVSHRGWTWSFSSLTAVMLGSEITTPLLNLLWMLRKAGLGNHWSATATGLAIIVGFVFFRVGVQAWQSYELLVPQGSPGRALWDPAYARRRGIPRDTLAAATTISVALLVLNTYWLSLMIMKALDTFGVTKGKSAKSKALKEHDY